MHVFSSAVAARRREMVHTALLVASDTVAMLLTFMIARLLRGSSARPFAHWISGIHFAELTIATVPLWVVIFAVCGLYRVRQDGGRYSEFGHVVAAVTGGVMLLMSFDYLSVNTRIFPSRSVPLMALFIGIVLVTAGRQAVRHAMKGFFVRGRGLHNVILIGTGELAHRVAARLNEPGSGYRVLAAVSGADDAPDSLGDTPVYPMLEMAVAANSGWRINEIVQADLDVHNADAVRYMTYANERGMSYRFVPDKFGVYAAASKLGSIDGIPVMEVRLTSLDGWGAVGKRMFDCAGALALLVLLTPVMLIVAAAIKLTEPDAPVLYRQKRIGLGGAEIGVLKFRSMLWKYSTGPGREFATPEEAFIGMGRADLIPEFRINHKVADDPRVSALGAFLRRTSLDELPQLFNALRGELSLVGPRPITPAELERYGSQATSFLALKPGMTGLWQVSGRSTTTYHERVKLDIYYVENWTIGMDMSILARTLLTVAARRGAC